MSGAAALASVPVMTDISKLPSGALESMAAAGEEVVDCMRVLSKSGDNIVGELLKTEDVFYEWEHYPKGDIFDSASHSQFYYHNHRPGEHGHFHTFLRPKGMPAKCAPAPLPDYEPPEDEDDALSHLIGISMDRVGVPIRLFTTNRWLTGEVWYPADDVCAMLDNFDIDLAHPSWPVNRWIGAMLRLFRPQIIELLHERDARMAEMTEQQPEANIYEDRDHEIVSLMDISIDDQIQEIAAVLEEAA
jgi:hypothetical protein